jgi:hypothetical protein
MEGVLAGEIVDDFFKIRERRKEMKFPLDAQVKRVEWGIC